MEVTKNTEVFKRKRDYSQTDKNLLNEQYAAFGMELRKLAEDKKAAMKEFAEDKKTLDDQANKVLMKLSAGFEIEEIECDLEPDSDNRKMLYIDRITGHIVGTRDMNISERELYTPFREIKNAQNS